MISCFLSCSFFTETSLRKEQRQLDGATLLSKEFCLLQALGTVCHSADTDIAIPLHQAWGTGQHAPQGCQGVSKHKDPLPHTEQETHPATKHRMGSSALSGNS